MESGSTFQSISPYGEKHSESHWSSSNLISIHLPLRGETTQQDFTNQFRISIHLPLRGETIVVGRKPNLIISIHLPLRGETKVRHMIDILSYNFNPSPLTGRNQYNVRICDIYKFQSISPYGEKLYEWTFPVKLWISIHLPLRGETIIIV